MRNFLLKTVFATFCFSLVFAFLSCDGIAQKIDGGQDTESEQEFIITGTLSADGAVPSEVARSISGDFESGRGLSERSARTAIPSIPSSTTYTVTATSGSKTVKGEVNGNSFTIKLSSGTWTVKAEGFSDSARNTKILEGTSGSFQINTNSVKNDISITLSPINEGSGKIDLTVNFENGTGINNVEMILTKVGSTSPMTTITDSGSTSAKLTNENIESGVYDAEIKFKSSSGELKYFVRETVNVFQNLTTDTWQGNAPYLSGTGTNKKFEITQKLVDDFSKNIDDKIFYVAGTNPSFTVNANDNNVGTNPFLPFATIQKAVDTINSINDETSTYKIKVDGTLEITTPASTSTENDKSAVSITPTKNLNLTIESHSTAKATVKANSSEMRVFIVGNGGNTSITPNVTMKNLIITGGNNGTGGGAGIKLEAGSLTLSSVEVKDNKTTDVGGGICVEQGNLDITNSEISENEASYGGGIYVKVPNTIKISGTAESSTKISNNKVTSKNQDKTGTAIHVCYGAIAELSGNVQIGNDSGTGIKIEGKMDETKTNIKITSKLTSTQIINISYANAASGKPIIERENYNLTQDDCDKFSFDNSTFRLFDLGKNKGILISNTSG